MVRVLFEIFEMCCTTRIGDPPRAAGLGASAVLSAMTRMILRCTTLGTSEHTHTHRHCTKQLLSTPRTQKNENAISKKRVVDQFAHTIRD